MIIAPAQPGPIPQISREDVSEMLQHRLFAVVPSKRIDGDQVFMLHARSPDA